MKHITQSVLFTVLLASPVALAQTDATSSDSTSGAVVTTTHDNTGLWGLLGLLGLAGLAGLRRQPISVVTTDRTGNPNTRP